MTFTVGSGDTGSGGDITMTAGETTASGSAGGEISLTAGESTAGNGGAVSITSGASTYASDDGDSGAVTVESGTAIGGKSGDIGISTGSGNTNADSGSITMSTGNSDGDESGDILLLTGDAFEGTGGSMNFSIGYSHDGLGGDIIMSAGSTTSGDKGGNVFVDAGEGSLNGDGGNIVLNGGVSGGKYGNGGYISIDGGTSTKGAQGIVKVGTQTDEVVLGQDDLSSDLIFYGHSFAFGTMSIGNVDTQANNHYSILTSKVEIGTILPSQSMVLLFEVDDVTTEDHVSVIFSGTLGSGIVMSAAIVADGEIEITLVHSGSPPTSFDVPDGTFRINVFQYE